MDQARANQSEVRLGRTLKQDVLASIVVFLVALPLCMGIAIASGIPMDKAAAVGIVTGAIGGLVVSSVGGCPLQISGPAAGLAVIVAQLINQHGFEMLGPIVLLAGAIQILAGWLRIGQWFRAVSPALIQGMLAGIGILILASQFHVMVDDQPPGTGRPYGGLINLVTIPQAVWKGFAELPHRAAATVGVFTIAVIVAWNALRPERLKAVPAPLVGVISATILTAVWRPNISFIMVPDNLLESLRIPDLEDVARIPQISILMAGVALAFVASAESLLTAAAVDAMQQHTPRTKYDRELAAQGLGNVLSGMLGLIPITGVIVRSGANVLAGARTRLSGILHGVWLLVFVAAVPAVLRLVPVASLAAVLVFTGWKLISPAVVRKLWAAGRGEVITYAITLGTVVIVDLLTGIVVGIGFALARLLYIFSHLKISIEQQDGKTVLRFRGAATFIRLPMLAAALEQVQGDTELHVHLEDLTYIDHACFDLLMNWERQHEAAGGRLVIDWDDLTARFRETGPISGESAGSDGRSRPEPAAVGASDRN